MSIFAPGSLVLGYAAATANFTTASATVVQVTSLTSTVSVPGAGKTIITVFGSDMFNNTSNATNTVSIWDGTVGSGTQIGQALYNEGSGSNVTVPLIAMAVVAPAAGSKTYNVGMKVSAGSGTIEAAATAPMFVMIQWSPSLV